MPHTPFVFPEKLFHKMWHVPHIRCWVRVYSMLPKPTPCPAVSTLFVPRCPKPHVGHATDCAYGSYGYF
jgi:hypothetical protein